MSKIKSKCRPSKGYIEVKTIRAKVGSPKSRTIVKKIEESAVPAKVKSDGKKDSTKPSITLDSTTTRIIDQIYNETTSTIKNFVDVNITSDGLETPLGILSFDQINEGKSVLKELSDAISTKDDIEVKKFNSKFFSYIYNYNF